ncbi:serpin family protein [Kitasatospora sp. NPDC096147]|uniref:serpin family protein n=1 Tax=Kitasatospora sp. NPDC096147 TaxID=3364093 RepID=UPI00380E0313
MDAVRAVNALTARWAEVERGAPGTVLSGLGVWPLLAFLATGAEGRVRAGLERAVGAPAGRGAQQARELIALLKGTEGVGAAVGLWTAEDLVLGAEWLAGLPADSHGRLKDGRVTEGPDFDAWASRHTDGLVPRFPLRPTPWTRLVLASALAVRTTWHHPFTEGPLSPSAGPWAGLRLAGLRLAVPAVDLRPGGLLLRETSAGPVTELRLPGTGGVEVRLLLGVEGAEPGAVLAAALTAPEGGVPMAELPDGEPGPGLVVGIADGTGPGDQLLVTTVPFRVSADHDLLARAELFGLGAPGPFPGISPADPLVVGAAAQAATAEFSAEGFRAGVVTAVAMRRGMPLLRRVRTVRVAFDRPFAWVAVHRATGMAMVAGWHTEPVPAAR